MHYNNFYKQMETENTHGRRRKKAYCISRKRTGCRIPVLFREKGKPARTDRLGENLYNGDVEMEVQGQETAIEELVSFLMGRRFVQISDMDVRKMDVDADERYFHIR